MTSTTEWERELVAFLEERLPAGWGDAVSAGDEAGLLELKPGVDNPAMVRALGRAPGGSHRTGHPSTAAAA